MKTGLHYTQIFKSTVPYPLLYALVPKHVLQVLLLQQMWQKCTTKEPGGNVKNMVTHSQMGTSASSLQQCVFVLVP